MNLLLHDPFLVGKEVPEKYSEKIEDGVSVVIKFNVKGDYMASGLLDGSIQIFDLTCGCNLVAKLVDKEEKQQITSLNWSCDGRYLFSTHLNGQCILWDLKKASDVESENAVLRRVRLGRNIIRGSLDPCNCFKFVVSIYDSLPLHVDITELNNPVVTPIDFFLSVNSGNNLCDDIWIEPGKPLKSASKKNVVNKTYVAFAEFKPDDGLYIFMLTNDGCLFVVDAILLKTVYSVKIANCAVKGLKISPDGKKLAINFSDHVIRQILLPDLVNIKNSDLWEFEVSQKYQDVINKLNWNHIAFNHNSEFLSASSYGQFSHDIYIWETSLGSLVRILDGPLEDLFCVEWNLHKCIIAATGMKTGSIYMWRVFFPQRWSALAPDFVEIEDNIDYEEKEDEFDINDSNDLELNFLNENDIIDVVKKDKYDSRGFKLIFDSFVIPIKYENNF